jgi:hypothetical protein
LVFDLFSFLSSLPGSPITQTASRVERIISFGANPFLWEEVVGQVVDKRAAGQGAEIWAAASDHLLAWGGIARARAGLTASRDWKCAIELFRGFCEASGYLVAGDGAAEDIEADPVFIAVHEAVSAHSRGIEALATIVAEGGGTVVALEPTPSQGQGQDRRQGPIKRRARNDASIGSSGSEGGGGGGHLDDSSWSPSRAFYHGVPRSWTPVSPHPAAPAPAPAPAGVGASIGVTTAGGRHDTPSPVSPSASFLAAPTAESLLASIQSAEWIDLPRGLITTSQNVTLPVADRPLPQVPLPSGEPLVRSAFNKGLDVSLNTTGHSEHSHTSSPIRKAKESHAGVGLRMTNRSSPGGGNNVSHIKKAALDALTSQSDRSAFR